MNAYEAMLRDHEFTITVSQWGVLFNAECHAKEGADCRLECSEGCAEWDEYHDHQMVEAGRCLIAEWICEQQEDCLRAEYVIYKGKARDLEFNEGWNVWLPLNEATE